MSWFKKDLTTLALLWRLERADGIVLGFTSHDRDLVREGLVYRSAPGMLPSAIERTDGLEASSLDLAGALTSDALTEADFSAGRWDGAALWVSAVDWSDASAEPVLLARGELGAVELKAAGFSVTLRGPTAVLDKPVVEETSPECRASLGDRRCRVDLAGRRVLATVVSGAEETVTLAVAIGAGLFEFGSLRWVDGPNAGLGSMVVASVGTVLTLREAPAFAVTGAVSVEITEGCDRRFTTCCTRFANAVNFRGEPHLPGNDLLTRYGG
ncbi:MAG: hypothetical protein JWO15_1660 [Sphingomonadales bacterium]|nr:hypothetical protein [Sphingomonadales bacterium]